MDGWMKDGVPTKSTGLTESSLTFASNLTSLRLSVLICEMGVMMVSTSVK